MNEDEILRNVEQELKNIITIRQDLVAILKDFNTYTQVLMNVEKRVKELEMKIEIMELENNRASVMFQ